MLDIFSMEKEMSVTEQPHQGVVAVLSDGRGLGEVAASFAVGASGSSVILSAWLQFEPM